jgi:hypothetical protein
MSGIQAMLVPEQAEWDNTRCSGKVAWVYRQYWLLNKLKGMMQNVVTKLYEVYR